MNLLPSSDLVLMLRTDFSDQAAWEAICETVRSPDEEACVGGV
ncbi:DUF6924 domain-containing protein [Actinomadura sp. 6N118]